MSDRKPAERTLREILDEEPGLGAWAETVVRRAAEVARQRGECGSLVHESDCHAFAADAILREAGLKEKR